MAATLPLSLLEGPDWPGHWAVGLMIGSLQVTQQVISRQTQRQRGQTLTLMVVTTEQMEDQTLFTKISRFA